VSIKFSFDGHEEEIPAMCCQYFRLGKKYWYASVYNSPEGVICGESNDFAFCQHIPVQVCGT
jgi:hypothetical protein